MTVLAGPVDGLRLDAESLLSKWGFGDGYGPPDGLWDWLEREDPAAQRVDALVEAWRPALVALVRGRLLPVLDHRVSVVEIGGSHNPVRADLVDGVDVSGMWADSRAAVPRLVPSGVLVPWADVWAVLQAAVDAAPARLRTS